MSSASEQLLKTQQVAKAFGLSVSTIKRWVDSGRIQATRTVGRHRLISLSEALRFAREEQLPIADLELLAGTGMRVFRPMDGQTLVTLVKALKRGRVKEAQHLIVSAYAAGLSTPALADELIRPALEQIGHDWESNALDVYQEHRASRIVESALMELIRKAPAPSESAPLALGATPEADLYTISGLLCELALRELGWDVVNLGPNLPLTSLAKAVRTQQPKLVWLSVHHLKDEESFLLDYSNFFATASRTEAAVVLGGPALDSKLRARIVAASFGDRLAHLCEFAKRLQPQPFGGSPDSPMERPGSTP